MSYGPGIKKTLYLLLTFFVAQTGNNFVLCSKTSEKQLCMVVLYKPILQQLVDSIKNQFDCSFTVQVVCSFLILGRHKFQLFAGFSIWSNGPIFWRYNFIIYKCQPYFMLELFNMDILLSKWFLLSTLELLQKMLHFSHCASFQMIITIKSGFKTTRF